MKNNFSEEWLGTAVIIFFMIFGIIIVYSTYVDNESRRNHELQMAKEGCIQKVQDGYIIWAKNEESVK